MGRMSIIAVRAINSDVGIATGIIVVSITVLAGIAVEPVIRVSIIAVRAHSAVSSESIFIPVNTSGFIAILVASAA